MEIAKHHLNKINLLVGLGSITLAIIGILGYFEAKREREIKQGILDLDLKLKQLQLAEKLGGVKTS